MKAIFLLALFPLAACTSSIEPPPLSMPLLNPTPRIKIVPMPQAKLAHIDIPMCHDGDMASPTRGCTVPRGDHLDIIMPPYESMDGKDYSDLFFHELEGHALRGLCHIKDGRGWKPCR